MWAYRKFWPNLARIRPPDRLEWFLIACTAAATIYFLHSNGYGWRAWIFAVAMLLFGFMAGNMIYELWFGRDEG